jgi:SAM-dependent methyltransferase
MSFSWPESFPRIPDEDWTRQPLGELALKYDTVETHGWYENLEPTLDQITEWMEGGELLIDYSCGTGILIDRLLARIDDADIGLLLADSSRKFLRLAVEKLGKEERVAFRLVRYLKAEKRLQQLDEVLPPEELNRGADGLVSTNAIHLYYGLPETLASWHRVLRPGARVFVQSGNTENPEAAEGEWIIDLTVHAIHDEAQKLVAEDDRYERWRAVIADAATMAAHDRLRGKFFLPVRPLEHYRQALEGAGFRVLGEEARRIEAKVEDWYEFLAAYHEGVIGWAGGSHRIEGEDPSEEDVALRLELMRTAMARVFDDQETFPCCWTYITAERGCPPFEQASA